MSLVHIHMPKLSATKPTLVQMIFVIICGIGLAILGFGLGASIPIPGQSAMSWMGFALLGFAVPFGTARILNATAILLAVYAVAFLFGFVIFGSNIA